MHNHRFLSKNYLIPLMILMSSLLLSFGCGGTTSPPITINETVYRAFCVGVGDYIYFPDSYGNTDLPGPTYDVNRVRQTLSQCRFGSLPTEFSEIRYTTDWSATKSAILQGITNVFSEADCNDISYFYFSGHGIWENNTSYLCPTEANYYAPMSTYISVDELEAALSAIPGIKVVFLDTCNSGGFIGKAIDNTAASKEKLESFNDEVINVFSQAQPKGLLTTNQYKVLTSSHYYQLSWEIYPETGNPFGVFTMALYSGFNYSDNYPADTNLDTKVSLQEAYIYVRNWVFSYGIIQDVQVYPNNSTFTVVEY